MSRTENKVGHQDHLVLGSQLSEMERLPAWVESLVSTYGIGDNVKFAINLCLEEVVSNVIRHGYANREGHYLTVSFGTPQPDYLEFTVDDEAPAFNPVELTALPTIGDQTEGQIGGQGIRLLRGFADTIEYEAKPAGNRLRIGFANPTPVSQN